MDGQLIITGIQTGPTGPSNCTPSETSWVSGAANLKCPGSGDGVVEEIDIYRSANLLIKRHGDEAAIFAAMQADACLEKGDLDGKVTWLAVIKAVEELQDTTPPDGDAEIH